jgi:WD40 repeat protein
LVGHTGAELSVAFSPDGKMIASGDDAALIRLWDVATGRLIGAPLKGHTSGIYALAFSPDGKMIASASQDATLRRWDVRTGRQLGAPVTGHNGNSVWGVTFSPDGKEIASASPGGNILLTDAKTGRQRGPSLTTGWVNDVAFSPRGDKLAAADHDGGVQIWPLDTRTWIRYACTLAGRNLWQTEWNEFVGDGSPYVRSCPNLPPGLGAPADAPAATYDIAEG